MRPMQRFDEGASKEAGMQATAMTIGQVAKETALGTGLLHLLTDVDDRPEATQQHDLDHRHHGVISV